MELKIRQLDNDDLVNCAKIYTDVFAQAPWNEKWSTDHAFDRLGNFMSNNQSISLVAETQGRVVGFLIGEIEQWQATMHFHLKEICIQPEFQRRGVGRSLCEKLMILLNQVGVTHIFLITHRRGAAQDFYTALGFSQNQNQVVMGRPLGSE